MAELRCTNCGEPVSWEEAIKDPDGTSRCPDCGGRLEEQQSPRPPAPVGAPIPVPAQVHSAAGAPRTLMRLTFAQSDASARNEILVEPGSRVMLGRDPEYSSHAAFFGAYPGVSRRHAVLWIDESDRAWVRDEYASNLTRVQSRALEPGEQRELRDGDNVRLCLAVVGRVELVRGSGDGD